MSTSNKISISGLINSTLKKGFTIRDALSELIDNQLDAGAENCRIIRFTTEVSPLSNVVRPFLVLSDDGSGMTLAQADSCYTMHNEKAAASSKNGFAGIGKSHAEATLTRLHAKSLTLSKTNTSDIVEIGVDWPEAVAKGTWNPSARDVSAKNVALFDTYAINKSHGTVTIVDLDSIVSRDLLSSSDALIEDFQSTYADYIGEEVMISMQIGESPNPTFLLFADVLRLRDAPLEAYDESVVEVWRNDDETRAYFLNGNEEFVRLDFSNHRGRKFYDYPPPGFSKVCDVKIESTYVPDEGDDEEVRVARKQGNMYFKRGKKILTKMPNPPVNSGNFDKRKVFNCADHLVTFDYLADVVFTTESNKSRLTEQNIDSAVFRTLRYLARSFGESYARDHPPVRPEPPIAPAPAIDEDEVIVQRVKALSLVNPEFKTRLAALIAEFTLDRYFAHV